MGGPTPSSARLLAMRLSAGAPAASALLAAYLRQLWAGRVPEIVLCIGSDQSTGDALGPLVGSWLEEHQVPVEVHGTLEAPVHAGNLAALWAALAPRGAVVLAVDACLGRPSAVGTVVIGRGPVRPGGALKRPLPDVGDYHITAVVNVGGLMEPLVLQNTRLATVMKMAHVIAEGIATSLP